MSARWSPSVIPMSGWASAGCVVVIARGTPPTLEDPKTQLSGTGMARQFWPERLELVEATPRTPAGKIQKYVLRERLAAGKPAGG